MNGARSATLIVLAVGCGRVDFDPSETDDAGCRLGPWSAPVEHPELATPYGEAGFQLSPDGLTAYYSVGSNGGDLYRASRPSLDAPFGSPVALASLDTDDDEDDPSATGDDLELYFTRGYESTACIFVSERATISDPWGAPARLDALCATTPAAGPYITPDGLTLYYTIYVGADEALYVTARPDRASAFPAGTPVAGLDPTSRGYPALSGDLRTIYFETHVPQDVGEATRDDATAAFGTPTALPFDTAAYTEEDPSVTADGLHLLFDSDRSGDGLKHAYETTRACE